MNVRETVHYLDKLRKVEMDASKNTKLKTSTSNHA